MPELKKYLEAVAVRQPVDRKVGSGRINAAVVLQLEKDDIPRLLEMLRIAGEFFDSLHAVHEDEQLTGEHASEWLRTGTAAMIRIEALAADGSKAKWGDDNGSNGHREPRS